MPSIGLLVKTKDGTVVGQAVIGETGRITATLDPDYFRAMRESLIYGFANDICIEPNLIPAEPEEKRMDENNPNATTEITDYMYEAKKQVEKYVLAHLDKSDPVPTFEVYIVRFSKTLQNWKACLSTTLPDRTYYELTFNGDKNQLYIDVYVKLDNIAIQYGV